MVEVLTLREMTEEEARALPLGALATAPARLVERARIVLAGQGWRVPAIAGELRVTRGRCGWIKRFNAQGLAGLGDRAARRPARDVHRRSRSARSSPPA